MKNFVTAFAVLLALSACGVGQPQLKSFNWSRDSYPPPGFSAFDEPIAAATSSKHLVTVWTTTYARQDMSKARGWLQTNPTEVVLCFTAPDYPPSPSAPDVADVAAAYHAIDLRAFWQRHDIKHQVWWQLCWALTIRSSRHRFAASCKVLVIEPDTPPQSGAS